MTTTLHTDGPGPTTPATATATGTTLALASRGDALTPYLFAALERRFTVVGRIDPELTTAQRYQVAALTVRSSRARWAEQFYKSGYATRLRSANAARQLRALPSRPDLVVQVHALFEQTEAPGVQYIDCTHRQSAELWPAWNPLRGRALNDWYRREQRAYDQATHLFAFCEPTRESLIVDYGVPADKVTVTGAGANLVEMPPMRTRIPSDPPTVLFIGNDFVRKGGMLLLEAFRRVRREHPEARLLLVGTRPRIAAQEGVEVVGRVHSRARIAQLYDEATVFCVPSYYDPYPLVLLEAMSAGVPVIATRQMGVPEMVTDGVTGRLVSPGDADALAAALLAAITTPEAGAHMAHAAYDAVGRSFTWDHVVDRMAPALAAAAPGGGR